MTILVGLPVSLSGQFQAQGRQALAGLQAWARDANARSAGSFSIIHHNDASDPAAVREVTRRLIVDDRVDILIGPYSSVLTSAAAEIAETHGKLLWNQGGASDRVYQQGYRWIVGILTPASRYLAGLLPLVRQTDPSAGAIAIARAATGEFPKAVSSGMLAKAQEHGFTTVLDTKSPASKADFTDVVHELIAAKPDLVLVVGRVHNDIQLARQLAESSMTAGAVVAVAAGIEAFQEDLGRLSESFIGPSQWEPEAGYLPDYGPSADQVMKSLRQDGHRKIDYPMAQTYAAGVIVERCLEEAGTADDEVLRKVAADSSFSTFYGKFDIDGETGRQIGRETLLVQWQEGRKVIVWPPELANGNLVYPWR